MDRFVSEPSARYVVSSQSPANDDANIPGMAPSVGDHTVVDLGRDADPKNIVRQASGQVPIQPASSESDGGEAPPGIPPEPRRKHQHAGGGSNFMPKVSTNVQVVRAHMPFKIILVVSLCVFTVAPAIILWMLSWQTATEGLNGMNQLGQESVEATAYQLRDSLIQAAKDRLVSFLKPTEDSVSFVLHLAIANRIFILDGGTALHLYAQIWDGMLPIFQLMHTNKPMTMLNFNIYANSTWLDLKDANSDQRRTGDFGGASSRRLHALTVWGTFARLNLDYVTNERRETIYLAEQTLNEAQNETTLRYWYIDQTSGTKLVSLYEENYHKLLFFATDLTLEAMLWDDVLYFNDNTGIPQMIIDAQRSFVDKQACVHVQATVDVWTISSFLKSMLSGPKERLFVNIRSPSGHLIGASHGKFFSHSDIDYHSSNLFADPPPISSLRPFTPLNSTDATILSAAEWIFEMFQGWDALPQLNTVQKFEGERFWLASDHTSSETRLDLNVFLIIDLDSKMGPIERHQQKTLDDITENNHRLTIILSCVVAGALLFALLVSLLLTRSLSRLAFGMDTLAMLEFADGDNGFGISGTSFIRSQSRFTEVFKCERSFLALERGLKAFVKYVPKDVVHLMVTGDMESSNLMVRRRVTILFMDIAGFTPLCEKLSAEDLMRLTSEYLQAMCTIIVSSQGTLDKFVGDCIMAIWNAPRRIKLHEIRAVASVLEMQLRLKRLHQTWTEEGLPEIHFRAGLNTGEVLVGNFGCDYRISYTCLGDGVNLASRLESLNKYLGTVVVVAETTFRGAANQFAFRKIGLVTVAGKTTEVPVYEPLYCDDDVGAAGIEAETLPGSANHNLASGTTTTTAIRKTSAHQLVAFPSTHSADRPLLGSSSSKLDGRPAVGISHTDSLVAERPAAMADSVVPVDPNSNPVVRAAPNSATVLHNWRMVPKNALTTMAALYERAYVEFVRGDLEKATRWLFKAKEFIPDDGPTKFLLEECARAQSQQQQRSSSSGDSASQPQAQAQQCTSSSSVTVREVIITEAERSMMVIGDVANEGGGISVEGGSNPSGGMLSRKQTATLFPTAWDGVFRFDQK